MLSQDPENYRSGGYTKSIPTAVSRCQTRLGGSHNRYPRRHMVYWIFRRSTNPQNKNLNQPWNVYPIRTFAIMIPRVVDGSINYSVKTHSYRTFAIMIRRGELISYSVPMVLLPCSISKKFPQLFIRHLPFSPSSSSHSPPHHYCSSQIFYPHSHPYPPLLHLPPV